MITKEYIEKIRDRFQIGERILLVRDIRDEGGHSQKEYEMLTLREKFEKFGLFENKKGARTCIYWWDAERMRTR